MCRKSRDGVSFLLELQPKNMQINIFLLLRITALKHITQLWEMDPPPAKRWTETVQIY